MTIPTNAKPLVLRDYEAQALASGRMGAIVRVVPERLLDKYYDYDDWCNAVIPAGIPCTRDYEKSFFLNYSPYLPGDYLWCKETWTPFCINKRTCRNSLLSHSNYCFKASPESLRYGCVDDFKCCWHSPITMPREACRHILRVKSVEVMRLQSLLCTAMKSLGIIPAKVTGGQWQQWQYDYLKPLWNSTVKPADRPTYGYKANPWVYYTEVERVEA